MQNYKILAKEFLSEYVFNLRANLDFTQEDMAEKLRITSRSYGDLERGKYCLSAVTLLFLLLLLSNDDICELVNNFRKRVYILEDYDVAC